MRGVLWRGRRRVEVAMNGDPRGMRCRLMRDCRGGVVVLRGSGDVGDNGGNCGEVD